MIKRLKRKMLRMRASLVVGNKRAEVYRPYLYHMGNDCEFYTLNLGNEPYLISLGNHVVLASNCSFITHDYSTACVSKYLGKNVGKIGCIEIGDNTFIGANAMIMPNIHIGKNCIVAAGSVVTKNIPDGEVWGGYPQSLLLQWNNIVKRYLCLIKSILGMDVLMQIQ